MPEVIGREPELAVLEEFLDRDTPWLALLLTGGPGTGPPASANAITRNDTLILH